MEKRKANHLFQEKSPYLQQHAFNPVNWYPWGEEALSIACKEHKPIFLSIGYSTCHWCHVMAHESFEDQEISDFLNEYFVSIKVDREERPGIDQLYMAATRAMTGGGGWPMSVFLFPDTRPFYAGTYFPPRTAYGRPGFLEILNSVQKAWQTDRKNLDLSAEQVTAHIRERSVARNTKSINPAWIKKGFQEIAQDYEPTFGGFGQAPKFPRPVVLDFLFRYYTKTAEREARDIALFTLDRMAAGGMYDHIGGGFHRYSVDKQWRVPHFEKMLYDQSQLASLYLSAYQLNANLTYKEVAVEILEYVLREMQSPEGGFYSAEDADSENPYSPDEHGEGGYYLWTEQEIATLLSAEEKRVVTYYYGVEKNGNALHDPQKEFTGRNILYQASDFAEVARKTKKSENEVVQLLQTAKGKLLKQRETRTAPHLDDKIITAWNGLMISALSRAAMIMEEKRFLEAANRAADFLFNNLVVNGNLKRRFRDGEAKYSAGLDDYSFLIQGLLDLYTASYDVSRLRQAIKLTEQQIEKFTDAEGGFYDTPQSTDLFARLKETYDGAEPSGNSVAVINFLRLSALVDKPEWAEIASRGIASFSGILSSQPSAMPLMLSALGLKFDDTSLHVVIVGEKDSDDTRSLLREIHSRYLPNTTLILADGGENQRFLEKYLPILKTVEKIEKKATAYVCEGSSCKMPVNRPEDLAMLLDNSSNR